MYPRHPSEIRIFRSCGEPWGNVGADTLGDTMWGSLSRISRFFQIALGHGRRREALCAKRQAGTYARKLKKPRNSRSNCRILRKRRAYGH
jgi:hypothetical protein